MTASKTAEVQRYWRRFCALHGVPVDQPYDAYAFGDSAEMADRLSALVVHGPKRAAAGLLASYEPDEQICEIGLYSIIVDGRGQPVCVVQTTDVQVKPLRDVDASFAWDEGEGERTKQWWLAAHRTFFSRERASAGLPFSDDMPTVFERFELVWHATEDDT